MSDLKDDLAALRLEREPDRERSRRGVAWVVVLVVLALAGVGLWRWIARERPVEVRTATVTERAAGAQASILNAAGYVTARRRATVSSQITGRVTEVNIEEGMAVQAGQILARLDDAAARSALALAQARLDAAGEDVRESEVRLAEARVTLERTRGLFDVGFTTQAELDRAQAEVDSIAARIDAQRQQVTVAERQVAQERTNLSYTVVRAPFDGVAISRDAQPGEIVSPVSAGGGFTRTGIGTIVDMSSLEIEVDVNESYINRVFEGQPVEAVLDAYPDWTIPARVIATVPSADRQTATVLVRIGFLELDPRILPDMGVKVTFLREAASETALAAQPATLVPRTAVVDRDGTTVAFVVTGDRVERRAIRVGGTDGDRVEVVAGLRSGDRVVLSPPETLGDGALIAVE